MGKNSPSAQPTNKAWRGMMSRCNNPNDKDYQSAGGKGIKVCEAWQTFEGFLADMGTKPEGTLLRRLDESADFEPGNCEWHTLVNARTNPLYGIWKGIRRRCGIIGKKEHAKSYRLRGVQMAPEWQDDFLAFCAHVPPRPSAAHSLDRIDNNVGYFPGNLQWALSEEQGNNREGNVFIEMDGVRRTLAQWARHNGVAASVVNARFAALFSPAEPRKQGVTQLDMQGKEIAQYSSTKEASAATGVARAALQKCLCGANSSSGGYKWQYTIK